MNNTQTRKNILATLIASIGILLATTLLFTVSADEEEITPETNEIRQEWVEKRIETKEAMIEFLETGDYEGWAAWAKETRMGENNADLINQDTFQKLQQAHELMEEGDKEGAKEIMQELGLKIHRGKGHHAWMNEEAKVALEAGNYEAFKEAAPQVAERIDEAQFQALSQLHDLKGQMRAAESEEEKEALKEELKSLVESSDLEIGKHLVKGKIHQNAKNVMEQLTDEQKETLMEIKENGNPDAAKSYLQGLGIELPEKPQRDSSEGRWNRR